MKLAAHHHVQLANQEAEEAREKAAKAQQLYHQLGEKLRESVTKSLRAIISDEILGEVQYL